MPRGSRDLRILAVRAYFKADGKAAQVAEAVRWFKKEAAKRRTQVAEGVRDLRKFITLHARNFLATGSVADLPRTGAPPQGARQRNRGVLPSVERRLG